MNLAVGKHCRFTAPIGDDPLLMVTVVDTLVTAVRLMPDGRLMTYSLPPACFYPVAHHTLTENGETVAVFETTIGGDWRIVWKRNPSMPTVPMPPDLAALRDLGPPPEPLVNHFQQMMIDQFAPASKE